MSTTLSESDTRYVIIDGPGRDRLLDAFMYALVKGTPPIQFTTGHGRSQFCAFVTGLIYVDPDNTSDDKKDHRFLIELTIDGRPYAGHYDAHSRSGCFTQKTD